MDKGLVLAAFLLLLGSAHAMEWRIETCITVIGKETNGTALRYELQQHEESCESVNETVTLSHVNMELNKGTAVFTIITDMTSLLDMSDGIDVSLNQTVSLLDPVTGQQIVYEVIKRSPEQPLEGKLFVSTLNSSKSDHKAAKMKSDDSVASDNRLTTGFVIGSSIVREVDGENGKVTMFRQDLEKDWFIVSFELVIKSLVLKTEKVVKLSSDQPISLFGLSEPGSKPEGAKFVGDGDGTEAGTTGASIAGIILLFVALVIVALTIGLLLFKKYTRRRPETQTPASRSRSEISERSEEPAIPMTPIRRSSRKSATPPSSTSS